MWQYLTPLETPCPWVFTPPVNHRGHSSQLKTCSICSYPWIHNHQILDCYDSARECLWFLLVFWNFNPNVMLQGGAFGRWLGCEDWSFMNVIITLITETSEIIPASFAMGEHSKEGSHPLTWKWTPTGDQTYQFLDFGLLELWEVNIYLLLIFIF